MNIKELLTVLDSETYLNIETEKGYWMYEGNAFYITSDLLERRIKLVESIRNEFFITTED